MINDMLIKKKVRCCSCNGSLSDSKNINLIGLEKEAKWKYPCWGNILLNLPPVLASAIICDKCLKENKKPKYAIEWNTDLSIIKYHPVETLVDVPREIWKPVDELEPHDYDNEPFKEEVRIE